MQYDIYCLGCCVYEMITKGVAQTDDNEFELFKSEIAARKIPSNEKFQDFSLSLFDFIWFCLNRSSDSTSTIMKVKTHIFL